MLINDIVSFEQLSPDNYPVYIILTLGQLVLSLLSYAVSLSAYALKSEVTIFHVISELYLTKSSYLCQYCMNIL